MSCRLLSRELTSVLNDLGESQSRRYMLSSGPDRETQRALTYLTLCLNLLCLASIALFDGLTERGSPNFSRPRKPSPTR